MADHFFTPMAMEKVLLNHIMANLLIEKDKCQGEEQHVDRFNIKRTARMPIY